MVNMNDSFRIVRIAIPSFLVDTYMTNETFISSGKFTPSEKILLLDVRDKINDATMDNNTVMGVQTLTSGVVTVFTMITVDARDIEKAARLIESKLAE